MCSQHNVRVTARDNTGHNAKETQPDPGQDLKFLTSPVIEPVQPAWKAGTQQITPRRRTQLYVFKTTTKCLKLMYTLVETLFLSNEMTHKYNLCCVLFHKLPQARIFSKWSPSATVHSQQRRRTERHTVRIIANGISLLSSQNSMNTGFLDTNLTRTMRQ